MKTILVDAWNTFFTTQGINREMYDLLETYPNPKIIATNANDEQMTEFGIDKSPYPVFSLKHNPDKVDPIFFQTLLKDYDLAPADVIYFEHNIDAVESARSVGITTHHYDKTSQDLVSLKDFLDKNL
jgi:HAD superfamily hydrolase (TIGR01509 family)